jgi:hypothetical protein
MYVVFKSKGDLILQKLLTRHWNLGVGAPCSNSNPEMRSPLKEKICNAINKAIQDSSYTDCSTLIVGGRRRNRKKKNKKNGQKKKKNPTCESIKTRLSPKICRKGENHQDSTPLIEDNEENKEENKDVEDDQEGNIHPDKTSDANGSAEQSQEGRRDGQDEKREDVEAEGHKHEEDSEVIVKEVIQATHLAPPLNPEDADTDRSDGVSLETSSPGAENDSQISQQPAAQTKDARVVKSEASPLIDKDEDTPVKRGKRPVDSRLRDQNPGFACCNIL